MKRILLFILVLSGFAWAQENTLKNDTLFLEKGGFLVKGDQIKLGTGSKDNGDYRHIEVSATSMMRTVNTNGNNFGVQDANALSGQYNDLEAKIIRFEERGTKRTGKKYVAIIGIGLPQRYQIDIDNAAEAGEIIISGYKTKSTQENKNIGSGTSVADELLKLKELKDAGVLTEEEFSTQKEKLINQ